METNIKKNCCRDCFKGQPGSNASCRAKMMSRSENKDQSRIQLNAKIVNND